MQRTQEAMAYNDLPNYKFDSKDSLRTPQIFEFSGISEQKTDDNLFNSDPKDKKKNIKLTERQFISTENKPFNEIKKRSIRHNKIDDFNC
jgi:hypothetical protein